MCPNCRLSKCPDCFAAEQKRLREKDELSKQVGRQSSPKDWEEDTSIRPIPFGYYPIPRGTGGGNRVIRKHIFEDPSSLGDY